MPRLTCANTAPPGREMSVHIADLSPGDTGTIQQVFAGLSTQSSYQRYQSARSTLPIHTQRRLADVRPGRHVAHVATLGGRPVGIVRWIRSTRLEPAGDCSAELAIEVIDAQQRRGIGRLLMACAVRSAIAAGVDCLHAYIAGSNRSLVRRLVEYGGVPDRADPDLFRLSTAELYREISPAGPVGGR